MSSEKDSRGYTAEGELKGAAKTAHEDKVARERDEGADEKVSYIVTHLNLIYLFLIQNQKSSPRRTQSRSRSPIEHGRGFDREGHLKGAAKAAHEEKVAREHGEGEEVGIG